MQISSAFQFDFKLALFNRYCGVRYTTWTYTEKVFIIQKTKFQPRNCYSNFLKSPLKHLLFFIFSTMFRSRLATR